MRHSSEWHWSECGQSREWLFRSKEEQNMDVLQCHVFIYPRNVRWEAAAELQYYNIQQTDTVQESTETFRKFDFFNRYIEFFFIHVFFFANIKNVTMGYFRTQRCTLPARTIRKQTKEIKPKKLRDSRRWVHVGNCWKTKRQNAWKTVCETSNWLLVAMRTQQRMIWYHWCHLNMTSTLFIDGIKTGRSVTKNDSS